jgi:hypothetical protein
MVGGLISLVQHHPIIDFISRICLLVVVVAVLFSSQMLSFGLIVSFNLCWVRHTLSG